MGSLRYTGFGLYRPLTASQRLRAGLVTGLIYATEIYLRISWPWHDGPWATSQAPERSCRGPSNWRNQGEAIANLLRRLLNQNGPHTAYILRIPEALPQEKPAHKTQDRHHPALLAPLTPRELEVLRLLADGS
jgi:hypothetical protein